MGYFKLGSLVACASVYKVRPAGRYCMGSAVGGLCRLVLGKGTQYR